MSESPPKSGEDERMPLWQHLDELRNRIIRALVVLIAALHRTWLNAPDGNKAEGEKEQSAVS